METATSVWSRSDIRTRRMAQKIIISHISNYLGSVLWGIKLIENDYEYPCLPLPTYRDYERLLSILKKDELFIPDDPDSGLILIGIQNVYFKEKNGNLYEEHRPEDEGKENVPKVAYLVVNENIFKEKDEKRFKCRDMVSFLKDVRAMALPKFLRKDYVESWIEKSKRKEGKNYKEILRDSGYSVEKINKISRKNKNEGLKLEKMYKNLSVHELIRKEFYKNRKTFDKKLERLRKMGLAL